MIIIKIKITIIKIDFNRDYKKPIKLQSKKTLKMRNYLFKIIILIKTFILIIFYINIKKLYLQKIIKTNIKININYIIIIIKTIR